MAECNKVSEQKYYKSLLLFIYYGNIDTIIKIAKNFGINYTLWKNKETARESFLGSLIKNNNGVQYNNFKKFFTVILKSVLKFKCRQKTDEKYAIFLSNVIDKAFERQYVYELKADSILKSIGIYKIEQIDNLSSLELQKDIKIKIKNDFIFVKHNKISLNEFLNLKPKLRISDSVRYFKVIDKINEIVNPMNEVFCPFCNPLGKVKNTKRPQGCKKCKTLFKGVKGLLNNNLAVKRIKDNICKTNYKGASLQEIRKKRLKVFINGVEREFKQKIETQMLKNIKTNFEIKKSEIIKMAENVFSID